MAILIPNLSPKLLIYEINSSSNKKNKTAPRSGAVFELYTN